MTDVFISYSRKDGDFVRHLTNALSRSGREVWVDWQDIPRGENWLNEIFSGIEHADAFVIVVSRYSLTSEICNDEIRYARERNKRIFPLIREEIKSEVFNEVVGSWYGKPWEQKARENWTEIGHLNWVFFNDDSRFDPEFAALVATLETDQAYVRAHTRYLVRALEWDRRGRKPALLLFSDEINTAETWLKDGEDKAPLPTSLHQEYVQESRRAEEERQRQAEVQARRMSQFRRATAGLAVMVVLAIIATIFASVTTITAQSTQATVEWQATYFALERGWVATLSAGGVVIPPAEQTRVPLDFIATVTQIAVLNGWQPIVQGFDGVEMVRVPTGCFFMGSVFYLSEQPVHEVCLDKAFWIDKYEVTNDQFGKFKGVAALSGDWPNTNQPRTSITWFEARDFCALRSARLPTEAEWEYAARGPNSLVYPWGNKFVPGNVIYSDLPDEWKPADVGSRAGGMAWVGAFDMSGNVMEWVSTAYARNNPNEFPYPYDPNDGREDLERTDVQRGLRGGGYNGNVFYLRSAFRSGAPPDSKSDILGFRCALSQ